MKIQLQRKGYSISCRHCFINFKGHAICSGCAKGYLLRDLEGKGETGLARLVHVFTLVESRTERNTIRPEIFNPDAETDTVVRYSKVMFRGGLTAMYTHHEYSIETTKCAFSRFDRILMMCVHSCQSTTKHHFRVPNDCIGFCIRIKNLWPNRVTFSSGFHQGEYVDKPRQAGFAFALKISKEIPLCATRAYCMAFEINEAVPAGYRIAFSL